MPTDADSAPLSTATLRRNAWLAAALYLAFGLLLPRVPIPTLHRLPLGARAALLIVPTAVFMLLQLWLAWTLVRLAPTPRRATLFTCAAVGLWLVTLLCVHPYPVLPLGVNLALFWLHPALMGFGITLAGAWGGVLLSRIVRERNVLLPVALVAMPIDYLGAMTPVGFTHNAVTNAPAVVHAVSVPVPVMHGLHINALIGPGDVLFVAFFFAAILRLHMNGYGTFWLMYALLTVTLLLVLFFDYPIAALVPMGIAVVWANRAYFTLKREEYFAMLYAGLLVVTLAAGFYFYTNHHVFHLH